MVFGSWQLNTVVRVLFLSASLALVQRCDKDRFCDTGYDRSVLVVGDRQVFRELKEPDNVIDERWENNWRRTGREDVTRDRLLRAEWYSGRISVVEPRVSVDKPGTEQLDSSRMTRGDRVVRENGQIDEARNYDSFRRMRVGRDELRREAGERRESGYNIGRRDLLIRGLESRGTERRLVERQSRERVESQTRERRERFDLSRAELRDEELLNDLIRDTMQSNNDHRREERTSFRNDRQQDRRQSQRDDARNRDQERDSGRDVRSHSSDFYDGQVSRENESRPEYLSERRDTTTRNVLPDARRKHHLERDSDPIQIGRLEGHSRTDFTNSQILERREAAQDRRDDLYARIQGEEDKHRLCKNRDVQERRGASIERRDRREEFSNRQLDPSREISGNWRDNSHQQSELNIARRTASHEDRMRVDESIREDRRERSIIRLSNERDDDRREDAGRTTVNENRERVGETDYRREVRNIEEDRKGESDRFSYQESEKRGLDYDQRENSRECLIREDIRRRQIPNVQRERISRQNDREDERNGCHAQQERDQERRVHAENRNLRNENRIMETVANVRKQQSRELNSKQEEQTTRTDRQRDSHNRLIRQDKSQAFRERNQGDRRQPTLDREQVKTAKLESRDRLGDRDISNIHPAFLGLYGAHREQRREDTRGREDRLERQERDDANELQFDGERRKNVHRYSQKNQTESLDFDPRTTLSGRREQYASSMRSGNKERNIEYRKRQVIDSMDDGQTLAKYSKLSFLTVIQGSLLAFVIMRTLGFNNSKLGHQLFFNDFHAAGTIRS